MSLLSVIIVGLIAGYLAHMLMKTNTGLVTDLILGVIGGIVGGWITQLLLGVDLMSGFNLTSIVVGLLGAVVVIVIYRFFRRGR